MRIRLHSHITHCWTMAALVILGSVRAEEIHPGRRTIWCMDVDGISLHKLDMDRNWDRIVGRLPYNSRYGTAEKNWRSIAETTDKKLFFVRADGNSGWMCHLYSLDTTFLKQADELQPLMVAQIGGNLPIQLDERRQHLGLTAGPDNNLYLTVYNNVLGDNAHQINGLWRIGVNDAKCEFVGRFKHFKAGQPLATDSDYAPRNAFFGGIAYDETSDRFYGYGFNPQGKPRLYWLPADFVKTNVNATILSKCWQTNGTEGLWGIAFDNYGFPHPQFHHADAYVSRSGDGIFKFRSANGVSSPPIYRVGGIYLGYGLALEPYTNTTTIYPPKGTIEKTAMKGDKPHVSAK